MRVDLVFSENEYEVTENEMNEITGIIFGIFYITSWSIYFAVSLALLSLSRIILYIIYVISSLDVYTYTDGPPYPRIQYPQITMALKKL